MSGPAASERRLRCHDASLGSPPRTIPRCESLVAVAKDGERGLSLAACRLLLTASNSRPARLEGGQAGRAAATNN